MRIAVTGATGFVGGRVVARLAAAGHEIHAYGRRLAPPDGAHTYTRWDIAHGPIAAPLVGAVVHCAGAVTDWGPAALFQSINVVGTQAVLATFPSPARFVHISTASVYDPWAPKHYVREDSSPPARYLNAYAASKLRAEQAVQTSQRDAITLRPHAIYGPGEQTLLPRLLRARRFGTLFAIGTGQNHLSLTHVENLVDAIELALHAPASPSYRVYNVADAITPTVDQALRQLLTELGLPQRIVYLPTRVAWPLATLLERLYTAAHSPTPPLLTRYAVSQLSHEYTLDISKAVRELGYQPGRSYLDGLTREPMIQGRAVTVPTAVPS